MRHIIPDQNAMMAKRAYYSASKVVADLINDSGCYPDKTNASGEDKRIGFDDGFGYENCLWGRDVATESIETSGDPIEKFRTLFMQKIGYTPDDGLIVLSTVGPYSTKDGISWGIYSWEQTETRMEKQTEKQMVTKTRPVTKQRPTGETKLDSAVCKQKIEENVNTRCSNDMYQSWLERCKSCSNYFSSCCDEPNETKAINSCYDKARRATECSETNCIDAVRSTPMVPVMEEYTDYEEYQEEEEVEVEVPVVVSVNDILLAVDVNGSNKGNNCAVTAVEFKNINACASDKNRIYSE